MILGICGVPDENTVKIIKDVGYRYIESWFPAYYGEENKGKLDAYLNALEKNKIRCEVGQFAFPGEYDPSGKQSKEALEKIREYIYNLVSNARDLNVEKIVIGGGGARVLPSPDKYDNVMEQMADILRYAISPVLSEFGIIAALEGLVKGETSILNTTGESVALAKMVDIPNIKVMADLYHVANENENFKDFAGYKGYIVHSHIGKPVPRVMPSNGDGYDYKPFFDALRLSGFNGRMSVEAGLNDPDFKTSIEKSYKALEPLL